MSYDPATCQDCNGSGLVLSKPYRLNPDYTGDTAESRMAREPCAWCGGAGSHDFPKVYDTAYPIDWVIAAGKALGEPVRGICWSYDGPGICGRPHGFNSHGRALLERLPDHLAYRVGS